MFGLSHGPVNTGINDLDVHHRAFARVGHLLRQYREAGADLQRQDLLAYLADYALATFAAEERHMVATYDPAHAAHRQAHAELVRDITRLSEHRSAGRTEAFDDLDSVEALVEQFTRHIYTADAAMVSRLHSKGYLLSGHAARTLPLHILLVHPDPTFGPSLEQELSAYRATIHQPQTWSDTVACLDRLKLDAVLVSLQTAQARPALVLERIRASASNRDIPAVILSRTAIGSEWSSELFDAGATHFLTGPMTSDRMRRLIRSIHRQMVDGRRLYRRAAVQLPVVCEYNGLKLAGLTVDISGSGMLADLDAPPPAEATLSVTLSSTRRLPETFSLKAAVARSANDERVALAFRDIPSAEGERLRLLLDELTADETVP